jgi:HPt (histidine-containing phosphotransfer) domain-containing protein
MGHPMQTHQDLNQSHELGQERIHGGAAVQHQRREVWDHVTLLWSVGNDVDFFIELVRKFLTSYPRALASIAACLGDGEWNLPAVESGAHTLRQSLQDLAAKPAAAGAAKLEAAAQEGDLAGAQVAFRRLQEEISELAPCFDRIGEQLTRFEF